MAQLSARKVSTAKAGKYSDGGNLYLIVSRSGSKKWVLRFTWRGKPKEMGLGGAHTVSLAEAREKAFEARRRISRGINPISERKRNNGIQALERWPTRCGKPSLSVSGAKSTKHNGKGHWRCMHRNSEQNQSIPSTLTMYWKCLNQSGWKKLRRHHVSEAELKRF